MRISDWSSDVCSSDLRPLRSFPIFPGRREHCPWPSIPRFRYPEPKERSLGWRLFQCCFLWRRSSVRKHWHGEPMAAVCVMSFEIEVRRRIGDRDIRLSLSAGSGLTALFGPSGAGKTSLLNMVAGLLRPDEGSIAVGEEVLFDSRAGIDVAPGRRVGGYVFQIGRWFHHKRGRCNLLYGFRLDDQDGKRDMVGKGGAGRMSIG